MIEQILQQHKDQFTKVMERYEHELSSVRTGRANPALLSTVMVESYGTKMPLQQVASITVSDAKTLTISPWDKGQLQAIEKGILEANLGFNPSSDGQVVRINLPPMSEDRRKEMVKLVGQIAEQSRIGIRQVREEIMKALKRAESDGDMAKDDVTYGQKKVQELIDSYNKEIKEVAEAKEKEIMTV
jgi:ribosome recycling factor